MRTLSVLALVLLLPIVSSACAKTDSASLDLANLQPLPTAAQQEIPPIRVAIAAIISPQGTLEGYSSLLNLLAERTGRPVELVQRSSYREVNELLQSSSVDIAFICTGAYLRLSSVSETELLAVPVVDGEQEYASWLIVPASSSARSIADLRNKSFAFTDPMSLTGRLYPTYLINQLGEDPGEFFSDVKYSYSHDVAINMVADGLVDGAAVDSLVYEYLLEREPDLEKRVRVVQKSPSFGIPPVVVSPEIQPELIDQLQIIFLGFADDSLGQAALQQLGIDRFVSPDEDIYDSAREVLLVVESNPDNDP